MKLRHEPADAAEGPRWPEWCCSYCSTPLEVQPHGPFCAAEGRWFGMKDGVHRQERRREIVPFLELYQRVRREEGWGAEPGLPDLPPGHPHEAVWSARGRRFRKGMKLLETKLGGPPWQVLEVGAGCRWASSRLLGLGHRVAAIDFNLDPEDGLSAASRLLPDSSRLPRAEAEMEALPLGPGLFDLVLAAGSLHHASRLGRTLVELRRVTRRGGFLLVLDSPVYLVLDSPVYRRRQDGEAMVADRMKEHARRYRLPMERERQSAYLVLGEVRDLFPRCGWEVEIHGWPGLLGERARNALEIARCGRRTARFPIILGRKDG